VTITGSEMQSGLLKTINRKSERHFKTKYKKISGKHQIQMRTCFWHSRQLSRESAAGTLVCGH
jgi:hypothetical protein